LFERGTLTKPLILILDETRRGNQGWLPPAPRRSFDAFDQAVIAKLVAIFRLIRLASARQINRLLKTFKKKVKFTYHDSIINFLYMNGVVEASQVSLGVM
jgi:hypothetical protein